MDNDRDVYFWWLYDMIKGSYYTELLKELYDIPFNVPRFDIDKSREVDGLNLRKEFSEATKYSFDIHERPCSFLEMLIAMAKKLDNDVLFETKYGDRTLDWFWMFIELLELSQATDDHWNYSWKKYVDSKCEIVKTRQYQRDGKGGMFYIPWREEDMRGESLWRQLMWYVDENVRNGTID